MNILMTGATGYLGSNLLKRLVGYGYRYNITILTRTSSNTARIKSLLSFVRLVNIDTGIEEVFKDCQIDVILHCATDYGRKPIARSQIIEANLLLPLRLLEMGLNHGLKSFINTDTMLDKRVSPYALSKRHFREWLESISDLISAVNISIEHFYGPGDDETKFVTSMIKSLIASNSELNLTQGNQKRDFIYIDDVVEAIILIIENIPRFPEGFYQYEVGSGKSIKIRDLVILAKKLCQNDCTLLKFGALPYRINEPMDVHVDISNLISMGWKPNWSLIDGLRCTIDFERGDQK